MADEITDAKPMNEAELAKAIITTSGEVLQQYGQLRITVQNVVLGIMKKIRELTGEIKDEAAFKKVLAQVIDAAYKPATGNALVDAGLEMVDGLIAEKIIDILDAQILDRFLGKDWYSKLTDVLLGKSENIDGEPSGDAGKVINV